MSFCISTTELKGYINVSSVLPTVLKAVDKVSSSARVFLSVLILLSIDLSLLGRSEEMFEPDQCLLPSNKCITNSPVFSPVLSFPVTFGKAMLDNFSWSAQKSSNVSLN